MALNPHFKLSFRNKALDDFTTSLGTSAVFIIYAGTQPADVSSAITAANAVCASLAFPSTNAFGAAAAGVITANTITSDSTSAGGTAAWGSFLTNTGTRVHDFSVGTATSDLILNSVAISTGSTTSVSAFTITFAA